MPNLEDKAKLNKKFWKIVIYDERELVNKIIHEEVKILIKFM